MIFIENLLNLYTNRFNFFLSLFVEHFIISITAIFFITIIGVTTGIYISKNRHSANIAISVTNFLYTIPSIALFGILVSISGIGVTSALIALILYGLLPVIRNTYVGIIEVEPAIKEAAIAMGSTPLQLLLKIELPLAMPVIIAGFRNMVIMTIALTGIASFIGAGGLGVAIWRGITTNYPEMTMAGSLLIAAMAIFSDIFLGYIEKHIRIKIYGINRGAENV
jgi:osmoprotectant transport system permease protein